MSILRLNGVCKVTCYVYIETELFCKVTCHVYIETELFCKVTCHVYIETELCSVRQPVISTLRLNGV